MSCQNIRLCSQSPRRYSVLVQVDFSPSELSEDCITCSLQIIFWLHYFFFLKVGEEELLDPSLPFLRHLWPPRQHADGGGWCLSWSRPLRICVGPLRPEEWRLCGAHSGFPSCCLSVSQRLDFPLLSPQVGNPLSPIYVVIIARATTNNYFSNLFICQLFFN